MVTYTSSSTYWAPLKPRIRIYAFSDTTYSSPLYTYDAFTDIGVDTKPIALYFDSQTTNFGTFSIEIEDSNSSLDADTYSRGNRVFIECSKDGTTWQPAFKGLVREVGQTIYARSARNITLSGYSYLVRLNERIVNTIKQSLLIEGGEDYDRTDSSMFTNILINDLLSTDSNYVRSVDDTELYSVFKYTQIQASPVVEWIPRIDAQLVTLNDAINSVLEYSNGLLMLNYADDELSLHTADMVQSPLTNVFLLTNQINQNANDADYTMYPLEPYKYGISYDYPDSGSRLIGSIGSPPPCVTEQPEQPDTFYNSGTSLNMENDGYDIISCFEGGGAHKTSRGHIGWGAPFTAGQTSVSNLEVVMQSTGNNSGNTSSVGEIRSLGTSPLSVGSRVGSTFNLYRNGTIGAAYPSSGTDVVFVLKTNPTTVSGVTLTVGTKYWFCITDTSPMTYYYSIDYSANNCSGTPPQTSTYQYISLVLSAGWDNNTLAAYNWTDEGSTWLIRGSSSNLNAPPSFKFRMDDMNPTPSEVPCGGLSNIEADNVFGVAQDRNMSMRIGTVERVISNIPQHVKTAQTLNEYLAQKLYYAAKARFTFNYPSVSMPNKLPKAGDLVAHVDTKLGIGTQDTPFQTGVISDIQYSFEQGEDEILGLRRLSLSTTGIKRGTY